MLSATSENVCEKLGGGEVGRYSPLETPLQAALLHWPKISMLDALKVLFILTGASTYLGKRLESSVCRTEEEEEKEEQEQEASLLEQNRRSEWVAEKRVSGFTSSQPWLAT